MDGRTPKRLSLFWMVFFIVLAVGGAVGANLWKRNLKVAEVRVAGNSMLSTQEVLACANIQKGVMLFAADLGEVKHRLLEHPFIRSASVNRDVPDRISITIEERVPIVAVIVDKVMYLDAEGYVLPAPSLSGPAPNRSRSIGARSGPGLRSDPVFDLAVLTGPEVFGTGSAHQDELIPGSQIRSARLKEALSVVEVARRVSGELYHRISEVYLHGRNNMILYTAESGVPVVFGRGDVAEKLLKLDGFWREVVQPVGAHAVQYIDLRFEDQVVVRWKDGLGPS